MIARGAGDGDGNGTGMGKGMGMGMGTGMGTGMRIEMGMGVGKGIGKGIGMGMGMGPEGAGSGREAQPLCAPGQEGWPGTAWLGSALLWPAVNFPYSEGKFWAEEAASSVMRAVAARCR